jgi:SagB-type dehydrogenase family enzyme
MQTVIDYHQRTKHHPRRYAPSPGFLDWANEPDPFRRYEGASLYRLPLSEKDPEAGYSGLYRRDINKIYSFSLKSIAAFLELSLGLSAWKSYGDTSWALRMNPSSGNLHPTEAYLILPPLPETKGRGGLYHYHPFSHSLEQRAAFDPGFWSRIRDLAAAEGFLVGLSSIYWRESWKYGERAFRYCQHDLGHAMAGLSFSGNLLGWKITYLHALSDEEVEALLGFEKVKWPRFEAEQPGPLFFVYKNSEEPAPLDLPREIIESFRSFSCLGQPNPLSRDHRDWPVIEQVSRATVKPRTQEPRYPLGKDEFFEKEIPVEKAAAVIRRRRSATAFDGRTTWPKRHLLGMLDKTIPRNHTAPFDLELGQTSLHLLVFIHRVSDLAPGLYFLVRDERDLGELKQKLHPDFLWERVEGTSGSLLFYLLKRGDFRSAAATAG